VYLTLLRFFLPSPSPSEPSEPSLPLLPAVGPDVLRAAASAQVGVSVAKVKNRSILADLGCYAVPGVPGQRASHWN